MNNRTAKERDDVIFAIKELHKFYSKPVPENYEIKIWMKSLSKFRTEAVVRALQEAPATCKYFPRPFDVVDILKAYRDAKHARYQPGQDQPKVKCDPKIAYAWSRFIRMHGGMNIPAKNTAGITMTDDEVIELCNKEARKHHTPDAIPPEYKLDDVWDGYMPKRELGSMGNLL